MTMQKSLIKQPNDRIGISFVKKKKKKKEKDHSRAFYMWVIKILKNSKVYRTFSIHIY